MWTSEGLAKGKRGYHAWASIGDVSVRVGPEEDAVDVAKAANMAEAAPEMLKALVAILPYLEHPDVRALPFVGLWHTLPAQIKATIAKAEGRS